MVFAGVCLAGKNQGGAEKLLVCRAVPVAGKLQRVMLWKASAWRPSFLAGRLSAKRQMPLRLSLVQTVVMLVILAAAASLGWDLYRRFIERQIPAGALCSVGAIRTIDNGSPQVCVER